LGVAAAGPAVLEAHQHLDALVDDRVRALPAHVGDEADAAGVVLVGRIVEPLCGDAVQAPVAHALPLRPRAPPLRRGPRASTSTSSRAGRATRARSVCVESTTIVSVRATPSQERMLSISSSSVSVSCVFTFSISVQAPVTW